MSFQNSGNTDVRLVLIEEFKMLPCSQIFCSWARELVHMCETVTANTQKGKELVLKADTPSSSLIVSVIKQKLTGIILQMSQGNGRHVRAFKELG